MGAGSLWALSLGEFMARGVKAAHDSEPIWCGRPEADETTGLALLELPDGFRYMSYSWTGGSSAGRYACPNLHDGMAVVDELGSSGRLILVRNHEGDVSPGPVSSKRRPITYLTDGAGGTTNLGFDTKKGALGRRLGDARRHRPQLRRRRDAVGHLDHRRGDRRRRPRLAVRGRQSEPAIPRRSRTWAASRTKPA